MAAQRLMPWLVETQWISKRVATVIGLNYGHNDINCK